MKKIKLPQDLEQLGEALSQEEMQEIHIGGDGCKPKDNCVCIMFLTGKHKYTSWSFTKTGEQCETECKYRCSTYDSCYTYTTVWKSPEPCTGSGSGCGSDCNCGSDCDCGSDCNCGSGSGEQS